MVGAARQMQCVGCLREIWLLQRSQQCFHVQVLAWFRTTRRKDGEPVSFQVGVPESQVYVIMETTTPS